MRRCQSSHNVSEGGQCGETMRWSQCRKATPMDLKHTHTHTHTLTHMRAYSVFPFPHFSFGRTCKFQTATKTSASSKDGVANSTQSSSWEKWKAVLKYTHTSHIICLTEIPRQCRWTWPDYWRQGRKEDECSIHATYPGPLQHTPGICQFVTDGWEVRNLIRAWETNGNSSTKT